MTVPPSFVVKPGGKITISWNGVTIFVVEPPPIVINPPEPPPLTTQWHWRARGVV